jgi:hypothetical protein
MQPNTLTTHHDTDPHVPPELLEALARALAAALIPPPRAPAPPQMEAAADFLTAVSRHSGWASAGWLRLCW